MMYEYKKLLMVLTLFLPPLTRISRFKTCKDNIKVLYYLYIFI